MKRNDEQMSRNNERPTTIQQPRLKKLQKQWLVKVAIVVLEIIGFVGSFFWGKNLGYNQAEVNGFQDGYQTGYHAGYQSGYQMGIYTGADKAADILAALGDANPIPVTSDSVRVAFMPEYGYDLLGSDELESNTVYRLRMEIPGLYWNSEQGRSRDNTLDAKMFYPSKVEEGERGRITVMLNINGEELTGVFDFTAVDELNLIHGNRTVSYGSSGGDIEFEEGALILRFYTGANSDFDHPSYAQVCGRNDLTCKFYPF